jgi:hypothetical protein
MKPKKYPAIRRVRKFETSYDLIGATYDTRPSVSGGFDTPTPIMETTKKDAPPPKAARPGPGA